MFVARLLLILTAVAFSVAAYPSLLDRASIAIFAPVKTDEPLNNPYIGLAPAASNLSYPIPVRLVTAVWTWRDLEPTKGSYRFEQLEDEYGIDDWYAKGAKLIVRVVLDYGTDVKHMDIPDWLYDEIGQDGLWYDTDVGQGFSPNYDNKVLIAEHERLLQALGDRYDQDPRIAFVALGSLGHWGEWHTYWGDDIYIPFPTLPTSDIYVGHYIRSFPSKKLLMRRPYPVVSEYKLGLYNDMFGEERSTNDFIDWFENGYESALADYEMPPMPDFWLYGPSGGEFGNADTVREDIRNDRIEETLRQARSSHTSWIGFPADLALNEEEQTNMNRLLSVMGYRFSVQTAGYSPIINPEDPIRLWLDIRNDGVAPFYYPWRVVIGLTDADGQLVIDWDADTDIRTWVPGMTSFSQRLPTTSELSPGVYKLSISVIDPDRSVPGIAFANEETVSKLSYTIGTIQIAP